MNVLKSNRVKIKIVLDKVKSKQNMKYMENKMLISNLRKENISVASNNRHTYTRAFNNEQIVVRQLQSWNRK